MVPATKPPMINLDDWRENSVCTMSMKIKGEFIPPSRVCIYIYIGMKGPDIGIGLWVIPEDR